MRVETGIHQPPGQRTVIVAGRLETGNDRAIEALKQIDPQFDDLHLAFYKNEDVGNDGVWDNWQLEGPSMIWYFRGDPHVHTWVNIEQPKGDPFKEA